MKVDGAFETFHDDLRKWLRDKYPQFHIKKMIVWVNETTTRLTDPMTRPQYRRYFREISKKSPAEEDIDAFLEALKTKEMKNTGNV